jgi:transposase InsO family protein
MAGERLGSALRRYRQQYGGSDRERRSKLLDEFCALTGYHRKYAISLLRCPPDEVARSVRRRRGPSYSAQAVRVLERVWVAADYPWSVRLKALLPLWLPWTRKHVRECTPAVEEQLLQMSARQMDRRLTEKKRALKRRIYGRTKPGSLLKQHILIRTDNWDVSEPGFCEVDLVSHSGPCAAGEFIHSFNITDIHTGWCETRAIMGKGEAGVVAALEEMRRLMPFRLQAIDSDNGSEFINHHLVRYCEEHQIQFTRGRPYKKDDNAHIEQKNWTRVRRIFGWDRYDTAAQLQAMNALYCGELGRMMNYFQPCVKLMSKERIGTRLRRVYDEARTPLDRLALALTALPGVEDLLAQRKATDPFTLSRAIEQQLKQLEVQRRSSRKKRAA